MTDRDNRPPIVTPPCPKCNSEIDTTMTIDENEQIVIIASCKGCGSVGNSVAEGVTVDLLDLTNPPTEAVKAWFMAQRRAIDSIGS